MSERGENRQRKVFIAETVRAMRLEVRPDENKANLIRDLTDAAKINFENSRRKAKKIDLGIQENTTDFFLKKREKQDKF